MRNEIKFTFILLMAILFVTACAKSDPEPKSLGQVSKNTDSSPSQQETTASVQPSTPSVSVTPKDDQSASSENPVRDASPGMPQAAAPAQEPVATPPPAPATKPAPVPSKTDPSPAAEPPALPPKPAKEKASVKAETVYKDNCMSCHGDQLQGKIGPNLQKVGSELTKDQIMKQITDGGGDMPAMGKRLSAEQIDTLSVWLAARK